MNITIVLPEASKLPTGGYKVQYEYADHLVARGHGVTVVHPYTNAPMSASQWRKHLRQIVSGYASRKPLVPWYRLDPRVRLMAVPFLHPRLIPSADITILTAWQTAEAIAPAMARNGHIYQIVYDYEMWMSASDTTRERMSRAMRREEVSHVATSAAVVDMCRQLGIDPVGVVNCGLDLDAFGLDAVGTDSAVRVPDGDESNCVIGFPARLEPTKGTTDMLEVCEILAQRRPDVKLRCFGNPAVEVKPPVKNLGHLDAQHLRRFYNECSIFVLPSHYEGWGLPAAEAMACGAAVVTTANGGTEDFATDGINSLVVPPRDIGALCAAVLRLIDDSSLRRRLAVAGLATARAMSWDAATDRLVELLDAGHSAGHDQPVGGRRGSERSKPLHTADAALGADH